jgi:hypothetical protein
MATTPATLKDLAIQVRELYLEAKSDAQERLGAAQAALTAARKQHADDTALLVAKNAEIAAKQAQLAASSETPADATALLAEIATAQVESRALQAKLLDDGDAVSAGEAGVAAAQGYLASTSAAFGRAEQEIRPVEPFDPGDPEYTGPAEDEEVRREAWRDAAPALDAVAAAAGQQLDDADSLYDQARDRVVAAVPANLLAAARKGYEVENRRRDRLARSRDEIEDLLADVHRTDGGPEGEAEALALELERAEGDLRAWSEDAQTRYNLAIAQLTVLAPPEPPARPPLFTPAEEARLAALTAAGDAAVAQRTPREEARADLIEATVDYRDAETLALADEPGGWGDSPPGSPPGGDLQAARDAFDAAETAYTQQSREDYAAWSAAVPEAMWRKLVGFVEAEATLQELRGMGSAALLSAAQNAEADLAEARWNAERHALTVAYLEAEVVLREGLLARAVSVRQQRLLSALRGDA